MSRAGILWLALVLSVGLFGCPGPRVEQIEVKASNDPLVQAQAVLERYASGQPLASEVSMFPKMVEDVRKVDPNRADILEKGLAAIQKAAPSARPAKARELLTKLKPSMN